MAKATHKGECQICGSQQKLPNGELSKHGYTTRFGFFEGVCAGAHNLPFEVSKDKIQGVVDSVAARIPLVRAEIVELETTDEYVWLRVYANHTYTWTKVEKDEVEITGGVHKNGGHIWFTVKYIYKDRNSFSGKMVTKEMDVGGHGYPKTLEEAFIGSNAYYIKHLQGKIAQMEQYITWQNERMMNWAPKELVEV